MQMVAWNFRIGKSTAMAVIKETCNVIWSVLGPIYVKRPSENVFRQIADTFYSKWNFPNCLGAVDGKHIRMQAPSKSGTEFYNYKNFFSLILLATCDADYKFTLVDIGASGSESDGGVLKDSAFGRALDNKTIQLPKDGYIINTNVKVPFCFLADEAFPLNSYIMRPFPGKGLSEKQLVFNYRLSRARRTIENAFGILASRWRVLKGCIIAEAHTVKIITGATVCLHNFIMTEEGRYPISKRLYATEKYISNLTDDQLKKVGKMGSNNAATKYKAVRNMFVDYFMSPEGLMEHQLEYINRGSF